MSRIIHVETCSECPYIQASDGAGHCGAFVKCKQFNIMLRDEDGPEYFPIYTQVHPDCKLEEI